jgi:hypothetical protein
MTKSLTGVIHAGRILDEGMRETECNVKKDRSYWGSTERFTFVQADEKSVPLQVEGSRMRNIFSKLL